MCKGEVGHRVAPPKEDNSTGHARTLRASSFIRDHQALMKHTERVIKQKTPTTAGILAARINHGSVCRFFHLLFFFVFCFFATCGCMRVCLLCTCVLFACGHLPQTGPHTLGMFAFVREISAACMNTVPVSYSLFALGYGQPPLWPRLCFSFLTVGYFLQHH